MPAAVEGNINMVCSPWCEYGAEKAPPSSGAFLLGLGCGVCG